MSKSDLIYLAIPYSWNPDKSYQIANEITAELLEKGFDVFSPVTHFHPIALLMKEEKRQNHDFWMEKDLFFLGRCDKILVVNIVDQGSINYTNLSKGVTREIAFAKKNGIPVNRYSKTILVNSIDLKVKIENEVIANDKDEQYLYNILLQRIVREKDSHVKANHIKLMELLFKNKKVENEEKLQTETEDFNKQFLKDSAKLFLITGESLKKHNESFKNNKEYVVKVEHDCQRGLRFNEGKPKWSLIDFDSLEGIVKVLEYGTKKYEKDNWKKGMPVSEVLESLLRHVFAILRGEEKDKESGLPHIWHVQTNAMFVDYMIKNKPEFNDVKKAD